MIKLTQSDGRARHVNPLNVSFIDEKDIAGIDLSDDFDGVQTLIFFGSLGQYIGVIEDHETVAAMMAEDMANPVLMVDLPPDDRPATYVFNSPPADPTPSPTVEVPGGAQEPLPGTETPEKPKTAPKPAKAASKATKTAKKASKATTKKAAAKKTTKKAT